MISVQTIDSDITRLTEEAFEMMLGSKPLITEVSPADPTTGDHLTAVIQVTGDWQGALTIMADRMAAHHVAAQMFASEDLDDAEVSDAFGEIVNVIGGQFKSLLTPPVHLSLPTVTDGIDHRTVMPGGRQLSSLAFEWEGHVIRICVIKREPGR